jgi:hypothetical protein
MVFSLIISVVIVAYFMMQYRRDIAPLLPHNVFGNFLALMYLMSPGTIPIIIFCLLPSSLYENIEPKYDNIEPQKPLLNIEVLDVIKKEFVKNQNDSYRQERHKAIASFDGATFRVIWDLQYAATMQGKSYDYLKSELLSKHNFIFPDDDNDRHLQSILVNNKFSVYEVLFRDKNNQLITFHKSKLI